MNSVFLRLKRNGDAACLAVRTVPPVVRHLQEEDLEQLRAMLHRARAELEEIELELSWSDADPRLVSLTAQIASLWDRLLNLLPADLTDSEAA